MAEEKKKIDLKARLGKGPAATPAPSPVAGPTPSAPAPAVAAIPTVGSSGPGLPVPPGVPIGSPALDPSNPLSAVVAPRPVAMAAPQVAQRIEVDEMAVQQAAGRARKTGHGLRPHRARRRRRRRDS